MQTLINRYAIYIVANKRKRNYLIIGQGEPMKTFEEIRVILASHKKEYVKKYGVKNLGIFGSFSRGDETERSDVDILVEFSEPIGLEFVVFAEELERLLDLNVDLVSKGAIKPRMLEQVKKDLVYV